MKYFPVAFSGYAQLWADKSVRTLFIAAFFARIPMMAAPLIFTLYVVGEGIEKKKDDFAAEVAAMSKV